GDGGPQCREAKRLRFGPPRRLEGLLHLELCAHKDQIYRLFRSPGDALGVMRQLLRERGGNLVCRDQGWRRGRGGRRCWNWMVGEAKIPDGSEREHHRERPICG